MTMKIMRVMMQERKMLLLGIMIHFRCESPLDGLKPPNVTTSILNQHFTVEIDVTCFSFTIVFTRNIGALYQSAVNLRQITVQLMGQCPVEAILQTDPVQAGEPGESRRRFVSLQDPAVRRCR